MTRTQIHAAVAAIVTAGYSGLTFYPDATVVQPTPPAAGYIAMHVDWSAPLQQWSRGGSDALFRQVVGVTFEIHVPRGSGLGAVYAPAEALAALFRGKVVASGEMTYLAEHEETIMRGSDDPDPYLEHHMTVLFERETVLGVA